MNFYRRFLNQNIFLFSFCMFYRLKELQEARIWVQYSQIWEENIYTERKGYRLEAHFSVLCPEVWHNGINPRNLITRNKLHAAIKFCLFSLSLCLTRETWVLVDQIDLNYCLVHSWLIVLECGRNSSSIFSLPIQSIWFFSPSQISLRVYFVIVTVRWFNLCNSVIKNRRIIQVAIHIISISSFHNNYTHTP